MNINIKDELYFDEDHSINWFRSRNYRVVKGMLLMSKAKITKGKNMTTIEGNREYYQCESLFQRMDIKIENDKEVFYDEMIQKSL